MENKMSDICEICGEKFKNGRVKSNHVRWKHKNNDKYLISSLYGTRAQRMERKVLSLMIFGLRFHCLIEHIVHLAVQ